MAKVALPPDVAAMFAACEHAYEQATQAGFGENRNVIAAVSKLRSVWKSLHIANGDLIVAKGFFAVEFASIRFERACWATREACIELQMAIAQAADENDLRNRCLVLAKPDQGSEKRHDSMRVVA